MDCRKKAGKASQLKCFKLGILAGMPYQPLPGLKVRQNLASVDFIAKHSQIKAYGKNAVNNAFLQTYLRMSKASY